MDLNLSADITELREPEAMSLVVHLARYDFLSVVASEEYLSRSVGRSVGQSVGQSVSQCVYEYALGFSFCCWL